MAATTKTGPHNTQEGGHHSHGCGRHCVETTTRGSKFALWSYKEAIERVLEVCHPPEIIEVGLQHALFHALGNAVDARQQRSCFLFVLLLI